MNPMRGREICVKEKLTLKLITFRVNGTSMRL
jgi:hypothetical protein